MNERPRPPHHREGGLVHVSEVIRFALDYRPPSYFPPYDSPLENRFAWHAVKYLHPTVTLEPQHPVSTPWGDFRLDFAVFRGEGKTIGIECDGEKFHSGDDAERDDWRDAVILGEDAVDAIYRLRGTDIVRQPHDLLHLMANRDPSLFSDRGRTNLAQLASPEAVERERGLVRNDVALVSYREGYDSISHLIIECREIGNRENLPPDRSQYLTLYEFAVDYGPAPLDEVRGAFWDRAGVA